MKCFYTLAALALLALPTAAFAQTCTQITAVPTTITQPGHYCLAQDFTVNMASGNAVTIATNDVSIDCGGRTLRNTTTLPSNTSVAIKATGRSNLVVEHCRVFGGWMNGIDLEQNNTQNNLAFYNEIRDNYVAGALWHGIRAYGSTIEITGNRVIDVGRRTNTYAVGIRVGGSTVAGNQSFHIVRDNYVVGTYSPYSAAYGIFSDKSLFSVFTQNTVVGTGGKAGSPTYGLYLTGQYNRVTDNHVTGTFAPGEMLILTTDSSSTCFDNYLVGSAPTAGCTTTSGY